MVKVQIINTDYQAELIADDKLAFPLTKTIADVSDISKRGGSFSKTVVFPGTKANNLALGQLYDINLESETFNRKVVNKCVVMKDGTLVFEGNLRLLKINTQSDEATTKKAVSYECVIYSEVATFYANIQGRNLSELDLSSFDHLYTAAGSVASWSHTPAEGYTYPLPFLNENDNVYDLNELRPAPFVKTLFDKIFANAGYTYTFDQQDNKDIQFSNLILPYSQEAPELSPEAFDIFYSYAQNTTGSTYSSPPGYGADGKQTPWLNGSLTIEQFYNAYRIEAGENEIDNGDNYDITNNTYTAPIQAAAAQYYTFRVKAKLTFNAVNNTGAPAYIRTESAGAEFNGSAPRGWIYSVGVRAVNNSFQGLGVASTIPIAQLFSESTNIYTLPSGTTQLDSRVVEFDMQVPFILEAEDIRLRTQLTVQQVGLPRRWADISVGSIAPSNYVEIENELLFDDIEVQFFPTPTNVSFGARLKLSDFVPKMSQSEFLKSVVNMFNLFIDVDENDSTNLIIKTRDNYFDTGELKDFSKKILKDNGETLTYANESAKRSKIFTYKQGKDIINTVYQDELNETYGQFTYVFDDNNLRGVDKMEIGFQPAPIVKTTNDMFVLPINGFEPKTNQLIVLKGELRNCGPYSIVDRYIDLDYQSPEGELGLTQYLYCGHLNDPINSTFELNFAHPKYLLYNNTVSVTNNNLFNLHWRRTMSQINNGKIFEAFFDLNENDFKDTKLNDIIFVNDTAFNILEISDFDATIKRPTKMKLITVDEEISYGNYSQIPNVITIGDNPIGVPGGEPIGGGSGSNPIPQSPAVFQFQNILSSPSPAPFRGAAVQGLASTRTRSRNIIISNAVNQVNGKYNFIAEGASNNVVNGNLNTLSTYAEFNTIGGQLNVVEGNYNEIFGSNVNATGNSETFIETFPTITGGTNFDLLISSGGTVVFTDFIGLDLVDENIRLGNPSENPAFINSSLGLVTGGPFNYQIYGNYSSVIGGNSNFLNSASHCSILGGIQNRMLFGQPTTASTIVGGRINLISNPSDSCSIIGGVFNEIEFSNNTSIIGGNNNFVKNLTNSVIIGGNFNYISGASNSVVIGGQNLTATTDNTVVVPYLQINDYADLTPRAAAPDAVEGRFYYNSTTNKAQIYDGTTWQDLW